MKFRLRTALFLTCLLGGFCSTLTSARAIQVIDTPQASTELMFTNTATTFTVSAQIAVDGNLIPSSVNLVRLNDQGQSIAVLGRMYDDKTHGDALQGDGKFTTQIAFNEPNPTHINLAITAAYKGSLRRAKSIMLTIPVMNHPTNAELQRAFDVLDSGSALFENERTLLGSSQARIDLIAYLRRQTDVAVVTLGSDATTVNFQFTDGLTEAFFTQVGGTQGGIIANRSFADEWLNRVSTRASAPAPAALISRQKPTPSSASLPISGQHQRQPSYLPTRFYTGKYCQQAAMLTPMTENGNSIIISPFYSTFAPNDAANSIFQSLKRTCGVPHLFPDGNATLSVFKTLNQYGVIHINTHGGVDANNQVMIASGEQATFSSYVFNLGDWLLGRIEPISIGNTKYWVMKPAFIQRYAGGGFPKSIVFASACDTLGNQVTGYNTTLANAFLNQGASAYLGYEDSVHTDFNVNVGKTLFDLLTDPSLDVADKTVGDGLDKVAANGGVTDPTADDNGFNATLHLEGTRDVAINSDPVVNGNFETGDLTGWTRDTTLGYVTASQDSTSDGSYSARIGRWDQPYLGTGQLFGPAVPGQEPFGQDFLYQDVQLPDDPAADINLTFNYNVVTYDGANYDWLDVEVRDPSNNSVLLRPVSRVGGIIAGSTANWGLYYTTGWQTVTANLNAYRGKKVRLFFGVQQDGYGDQCAAYIDQVSIQCNH